MTGRYQELLNLVSVPYKQNFVSAVLQVLSVYTMMADNHVVLDLKFIVDFHLGGNFKNLCQSNVRCFDENT